jgi:hypothetical protein
MESLDDKWCQTTEQRDCVIATLRGQFVSDSRSAYGYDRGSLAIRKFGKPLIDNVQRLAELLASNRLYIVELIINRN